MMHLMTAYMNTSTTLVLPPLKCQFVIRTDIENNMAIDGMPVTGRFNQGLLGVKDPL